MSPIQFPWQWRRELVPLITPYGTFNSIWSPFVGFPKNDATPVVTTHGHPWQLDDLGYLHDLGNPNIYRWLFDIFLYFPIFSYIFIHFLLFIGFFKIFPLNTQELRACQSTGLSHQPPSVRTMAATTSTPAWLLDVARSLHGGEALRWHGGFHSHGGTPIAGWFTLW